MSPQLPDLEDSDGNHIDSSSRSIFARRRRLGLFALAQGLALSRCQEEYSHAVVQNAASFPNGGLLVAAASLSGLEVLRLPELLVLIKRTADWARNCRVLNPREAMVPDEVQEEKVLYARARAWPMGAPQLRAEPKWQKPGDVEAAFFALVRCITLEDAGPHSRLNEKNPTPVSKPNKFFRVGHSSGNGINRYLSS
jgi:hypothetical protein